MKLNTKPSTNPLRQILNHMKLNTKPYIYIYIYINPNPKQHHI